MTQSSSLSQLISSSYNRSAYLLDRHSSGWIAVCHRRPRYRRLWSSRHLEHGTGNHSICSLLSSTKLSFCVQVVDEAEEHKENVPKSLCRMDNHVNCVNCVRWSPDGKYLASGGDDKVIMIWQIAHHGSAAANAFTGSSNAEIWRCAATLRGHSGDILDLSWSPTNNWLASCSVDNTIIVWNVGKWNEIVTTIRGHTGMVKGVSFDPIGKYLSSQSDDKVSCCDDVLRLTNGGSYRH